MTTEIENKAFEKCHLIPKDVSEYLRHEVNNKLSPIIGCLELLAADGIRHGICEGAKKSAWDLKAMIDKITEQSLKGA